MSMCSLKFNIQKIKKQYIQYWKEINNHYKQMTNVSSNTRSKQ